MNSWFPNVSFDPHRHYFLLTFSFETPYDSIVPWTLDFRTFPSIRIATTFVLTFYVKTIWQQLCPWTLGFLMFPAIHIATTVLLTFSFENHMTTNSFRKSCSPNVSCNSHRNYFLFNFAFGNHMTTTLPMHSWFPNAPAIRIATTVY